MGHFEEGKWSILVLGIYFDELNRLMLQSIQVKVVETLLDKTIKAKLLPVWATTSYAKEDFKHVCKKKLQSKFIQKSAF